MKNTFILIISCIGLCGCQSQKVETPTSGSLDVIVAESHGALFTLEAEAFQRIYTDAKVTVKVTTTRDAIVQLLNDSAKIICVDRPLNQEEQDVVKSADLKITETKVAEDALAIIVNSKNPMQKISFQSLEGIFSGKIANWQQTPESQWSDSEIQLAMTGRNSGSYELIIKRFLKISAEPVIFAVPETQKAVLDYVMTHRYAIGVVSVPVIHDTTSFKNIVRVLQIETLDSTNSKIWVKLHQANIYHELYPLHYPVYIYSTTGATSLAAGFMAFVAGATGQKIILEAGLVPTTMPVRIVQLK